MTHSAQSPRRGSEGASLVRLASVLVCALLPAVFHACSKEDAGSEEGAPSPPPTPSPFVNISAQARIDFQHTFCGTGERFMAETNMSGVGWLDYDRDGWLDLYFVQGAPLPGQPWPETPTNRLYRNRGDGTFEDVTAKTGAGDTGVGMGVACADYDSDGWPDIYVCNWGPNRLYHNNGDGTFTDVTEATGVGDPRWSSSALFADFDNDGDLDLFVANYVDFAPERNVRCGYKRGEETVVMYCHPDVYDGLPSSLYRNNGDGTFTDVSDACGIRDVNWFSEGKGFAAAPSDLDDDGDIDIFVANDATPNFLFINQGDLRFVNEAPIRGVAFDGMGDAESCMGADWADYDRDGDFDLFVCNIQRQTNTLYENTGKGAFFEDTTYAMGLGEPSFLMVGFSTFFLDFDNDGDADIFVANGHMIDNIELLEPDASFAQPPHLYENLGDRRGFRLVSEEMGGVFEERYVGRASAPGDFDNDGDLDIALNTMGGPGLLIANNVGERASWIGLKLRGTKSNRDAIGARVTVSAGDLVQIDEVRGSVGIGSFRDLRLLFGLGSRPRNSMGVDKVEIRWPSGKRQTLTGLAPRSFHEIVEPAD
ncbi:MAG: CRTAC1 family protein [Planctomycetota bacterium]